MVRQGVVGRAAWTVEEDNISEVSKDHGEGPDFESYLPDNDDDDYGFGDSQKHKAYAYAMMEMEAEGRFKDKASADVDEWDEWPPWSGLERVCGPQDHHRDR